ncbi:MAG TPA: YceI family protein [Dehalococcoidia bacterium]|nr:YceI family protein [Dehalococcoidia bacterium]
MKALKRTGLLWAGIAAISLTACTAQGSAPAGGSAQTTPVQPTTAAQSAAPAQATTPASAASPTTARSAASPAVASPAAASPASQTSARRTYEIRQESSTARFIIDEVLRGAPFTVNGTTNQITGQITADPSQPNTAQVGTIRIDARSFATDDPRRDQAIQRWVLETEQFPEITFTPKELRGLPATGRPGETYNFQIVGDLGVHGVTREETFDATLTIDSPDRLSGTAQTTIRYADFGINVPQPPFIQGIADSVRLELDFVATPA